MPEEVSVFALDEKHSNINRLIQVIPSQLTDTQFTHKLQIIKELYDTKDVLPITKLTSRSFSSPKLTSQTQMVNLGSYIYAQ